MISRELAKMLEAAGYDNGGVPMFIEDDFFPPSLSELIKACGDPFYSLVYATDNDWRCFSETDSFNTVAVSNGRTPEEAVARLWLALKGV